MQEANPLDSSAEPDPGLGRLPFGPLVTVDPDLHRVREVGAHLHERRPEIVVPDVEVVAGHPPLGHREGEPHRLAPLFLGGGEHRRELLRHPDRGHPRPAGGLPGQIRPHHLDLAVVLAEPHHRDVIGLGERRHRPAKRRADLLEDRRRRNLITQMRGQERDHRPTRLQGRHIAIQTDAIQTLNIQRYMPIEHIVHRHRRSHPNSLTATRPADQPHTSAVRGEASLVVCPVFR